MMEFTSAERDFLKKMTVLEDGAVQVLFMLGTVRNSEKGRRRYRHCLGRATILWMALENLVCITYLNITKDQLNNIEYYFFQTSTSEANMLETICNVDPGLCEGRQLLRNLLGRYKFFLDLHEKQLFRLLILGKYLPSMKGVRLKLNFSLVASTSYHDESRVPVSPFE